MTTVELTHIWLSAHHWPPSPPVVRTYCGQRFEHKGARVLLLEDSPEKASCLECREAWGQDQLEAAQEAPA